MRTFCAAWEAKQALGVDDDTLEKLAASGDLRVMRTAGKITEVTVASVNNLAQQMADAPQQRALAESRGRLRETELAKIARESTPPWFAGLFPR